MSFRSKVKNIDKHPDAENYYDVEKEICVINGETYPMFYAKIINKVLDNEMPFILFLGKPGTGKGEAAARLGYELHERINFYSGGYEPDQNIHYDNLSFLKSVRTSSWSVKHKPEINTTLHAMDWNDKENRQFEVMLNLARVFNNLITGDAQKLSRVDRAIKENHTFRFVATGGSNEYAFNVYYIHRPADADYEEYEKQYLMTWRPKRPPKKFREYIEKMDKEWKADRMDEGIEAIEKKRKEEDMKKNITRA